MPVPVPVVVAPLLVVVPVGAVVPVVGVVVCVVSLELVELDDVLLEALDPVLAVLGDATTVVVIFACAAILGTLVGAGAATCSLPQAARTAALSTQAAITAARRDGRPRRGRLALLIGRSGPSDGRRPGNR